MPAMTKRLLLLMFLSFATGFALAVWAEDLILRRQEDQLRFIAPKVHFVAGRTVDRLREGIAVPVNFQFTIAVGNRQNVVERMFESFVISYDLWEERFKVVRLKVEGAGQRKSASNLTALQTEAWCYDQMGLSLANIPKNQPLFMKLEIRADDSGSRAPLFNAADTFNLTALINLFSRPAERQQPHWTLEAGPIGYTDLKQSM
jgi:hypothetical protein